MQDLKLTRGGTAGNGVLSLDASGTLSHNHADEDGGGLHTPDGVWLRDSIVDENTSDGTGGGVFGGGHVQAATIPIPVDSKPKVFLPYITKNAK